MKTQAEFKRVDLNLPFVQHHNYCEALKSLHAMCSFDCAGRLVMVTGPAGAGKSSLLNEMKSTLGAGRPGTAGTKAPNILSIFARNPQLGFFSSKDFYTRLNELMGDPFITSSGLSHSGARVNRSEPKIQQGVERLIVAHGVTHIFIDEANLMCLNHLNRAPSDHLERLKVLAEETGITVVLFGTYDMLQLWNHSAQLNRRNDLVHLAPYDVSAKTDVKVLCGILSDWSLRLPPGSRAVLIRHAKAIGLASHGVVGQMANLVVKANKNRVIRGADMLESCDIEAALPHLRQLCRGEKEIAVGTAQLTRISLDLLGSMDLSQPSWSRFDKHNAVGAAAAP